MNLKDLFSITPLWMEASIICWSIPSHFLPTWPWHCSYSGAWKWLQLELLCCEKHLSGLNTWSSDLKVFSRLCSQPWLRDWARLKVNSHRTCVLWHVGKWFLFAVDKPAIYHRAIFALRCLTVYFISVCWSSLNRAKGLGEVSSMSWGGSLSSKSITIT